MNMRLDIRIATTFALLLICINSRYIQAQDAATNKLLQPYISEANKSFEKDIAAFEAKDTISRYTSDSILVVGSSSIRLWDNIGQSLAPYKIIQRGFGGSKFSDVAVYASRLINPYPYQALVLFAANDITGKPNDHSPEEISKLVEYTINVSKSHQPTAPVFVIEVTPTPSRFKVWGEQQAENAALKQLCESMENVYYIDTSSAYLNADGTPKPELFREDMLHQNAAGYAIWAELIKAKLNSVL